jgi:SpoIIAA-like
MIKPIPDLPANVIGFEFVGSVTADDYVETLEPMLDAARASGNKIRAVAVLGSEFEGWKGGAMLEDAKVGLGLWSAWERIAIVSDRRSIEESIHLLGWLVPGEVKVFLSTELDAAATWASES